MIEDKDKQKELKNLHNWFSRDIQFYILAYLSVSPIAFNLEKIREYVCDKYGLKKDDDRNKIQIDCNIFYLVDSGLVGNEPLLSLLTYKITAKGIDLLINDNGSYLKIKN